MVILKIFITLLITALCTAIAGYFTVENDRAQRILKTIISLHGIMIIGIILYGIWSV